ncbi:YoaK family protein [Acidisphaera sp. S103]|uniref:YoaK family protein n=1 Tax=Acidisphaera sp. S103 TaxID=1747223 RepID=UPI00131D57B2|nr:YoaK family protein [Acidisphaera sp. S103]
MLVREGIDRDDTTDLRLASLLAAVAGALNAAAFYAVGFFSANMTGNVSTLSGRLATGQFGSGLFYLAILLAFVAGAASSAWLISAGRRRGIQGIYAFSIFTEAVLLMGLGGADLWLLDVRRVPVMVLGLAFLMGLQNAVVTRISGARVRTTHISGMATDIGIELATALDILRGRVPSEEASQNWTRLRLHLCTVLSFLVGGVIGVLVYRAVGGWLLIGASAILLVPAIIGVRRSRSAQMRMITNVVG